MTRQKSTKRALLFSALSLLMCVSMLIGSTFAWFTDSVTSESNKIKAGTLDIQLMMNTDGSEYKDISDSTSPIFGAGSIAQNNNAETLWEPGKTQVAYLAIKNNGNLALKYKVALEVENISKDLYKVMEYAIVPDAQYGSVGSWTSGNNVEVGTQPVSDDVSLAVGVTHYFALAIHMDEEAGNEYQGGEVNFDLTILAAQDTVESDSFNNQYDVNATYPQVVAGTYGGGDTITVGDVSVTLPAEAEEDVYSLKVDNVTENTDTTGQTTLSLNIDLLKNGVKVNAETGVTYAVDICVGKNLDIIDVKHEGESIIGFTYDIDTGIVSFETDSFSPFEIVYKTLAAKVGNNVYYTIDDAIANWTNNSTLTLLSDVTLSDVIKLSSTEYHILDLGIYTMTAAKNKDAIQIENNGRASASYALDIKTDTNNPGGITAKGKAIVRTAGKSSVKDRPIIRFYNGVFNASYIVYHTGSNGTNCPQFQFHAGEYNGTVYTNRTLNQFYGGTFNGSLMMSVDSSAYTLIAGGRFKQLSNLYMSALNSNKFTIGSAKGTFDKEVYVNDDGYYVVTSTKPADIAASVEKTPGTNDYLAYSKVKSDGKLDYTDVYVALKNNRSANITVYVNELDLAGISFTGTIIVPEGNSLSITNAPDGLNVEGNVTYR